MHCCLVQMEVALLTEQLAPVQHLCGRLHGPIHGTVGQALQGPTAHDMLKRAVACALSVLLAVAVHPAK